MPKETLTHEQLVEQYRKLKDKAEALAGEMRKIEEQILANIVRRHRARQERARASAATGPAT